MKIISQLVGARFFWDHKIAKRFGATYVPCFAIDVLFYIRFIEIKISRGRNGWLGNVRELENMIERAVVLTRSEVIEAKDVEMMAEKPPTAETGDCFNFEDMLHSKLLTVDELVNRYIQFVLQRNHGAKEKTAKDLQIDRKTLYRRLKDIENHPQLN